VLKQADFQCVWFLFSPARPLCFGRVPIGARPSARLFEMRSLTLRAADLNEIQCYLKTVDIMSWNFTRGNLSKVIDLLG